VNDVLDSTSGKPRRLDLGDRNLYIRRNACVRSFLLFSISFDILPNDSHSYLINVVDSTNFLIPK
jgi:hypothetical protein